MVNEPIDWKEKAKLSEARSQDLEARLIKIVGEVEAHKKALKKPPLRYATVTYVDSEKVGVCFANGDIMMTNVIPDLETSMYLSQTVLLDPETYTIVDLVEGITNNTTTIVKEVLEDGRVKIDANGKDKLVNSAVEVNPGDNVVVDNGYNIVMESLGKKSNQYFNAEIPDMPWEKIAGLEKTIIEIKRDIIRPFMKPELYKNFPSSEQPKGVLFHGAPGNGKTMLGKALAHSIGEGDKNGKKGHFLYLAGSEFLKMYVGQGESLIRSVFSEALGRIKETGDKVVLFVDECDAALKQRGTGISSDATDSLVNQWLAEMDGINNLQNLLVVLSSNRPELIDNAVLRPGRIDRRVFVPRPDKEAAQKIFELYLNGNSLEGNLEDYSLSMVNTIYDGPHAIVDIIYKDGTKGTVHFKDVFSGAAAKSIVGRSIDFAIDRAEKEKNYDPAISKKDLHLAIQDEYKETLPASITRYDLEKVAGEKFSQIKNTSKATSALGREGLHGLKASGNWS